MNHYNVSLDKDKCAEGDLYKVITLHGQSFPLYYGYYDECDRNNHFSDPMPIYPDFRQNPHYTKEGFPFATKMQDACSHYAGVNTDQPECAECIWYRHGQDLLGICLCPHTRRPTDKKR